MKLTKLIVVKTVDVKTFYYCYVIPQFYGSSYRTFTMLFEYVNGLFGKMPNNLDCRIITKSRWYKNLSMVHFTIEENQYQSAIDNEFIKIDDIGYYVEECA